MKRNNFVKEFGKFLKKPQEGNDVLDHLQRFMDEREEKFNGKWQFVVSKENLPNKDIMSVKPTKRMSGQSGIKVMTASESARADEEVKKLKTKKINKMKDGNIPGDERYKV